MARFAVGQRVLYTSPHVDWVPYGMHRASMGNNGYMPLDVLGDNGNIQPISGTILKVILQQDGGINYDFAPDGWLTPESGWPRGFQAEEKYFSELPDPETYLPGQVLPLKK